MSESVYVFERGGWSESMCDSHVNCVRNYAIVSGQNSFEFHRACIQLLMFMNVSVDARACVKMARIYYIANRSLSLKFLRMCNGLAYAICRK